MLEALAKTMRTVALTIVLTSMLFVHLEHERRVGAEDSAAADDQPAEPAAEGAEPAAADDGPAVDGGVRESEASATGPPELRFPLPMIPSFGDTFGDPRPGGRRHEGVDLMAPKRTPVHAAAAGTVRWLHDEPGGRCCSVALTHENGWRTRYLHLDNDAPGTDDGLAVGIAPGLEPGAFVEAGQLIGWVGDSGNAEEVGSHLHFELRDASGAAVNATALLKEASGAGEDGPAAAAQ